MKFKYKCKDNDARLKFIECNGSIDEVWIQTNKYEGSWTIIGFKDLQEGIKLASKKFSFH